MATLPLLLEPTDLEKLLENADPNLLILDTSSAENYQKHHVPGAIHLAASRLQRGEKPAPGKLPHAEDLKALFSEMGLTADKHVIAYDDEGGGWAGRLIWTLDVLGHKNYSYLNGGLPAWVNEGHPVETTPNTAQANDFTVNINNEVIAELDDVLASIDDPNTAVWDARSAKEYSGEKVVAARGGHIPGAFNIDWLELMDKENNLRLIDLNALQTRLDELGADKDKQVITHCQTHHRSGLSYLAMKLMGYQNIKGYHGSWGEYGNREDTPIDA